MTKLNSNVSRLQNSVIIDLIVDDLYIDNIVKTICETILPFNERAIILNLEALSVITRDDLKQVCMITSAVELTGHDVIVCGFSPINASLLMNFTDEVPFKTELDVSHAVEAIHH